MFEPLRLNAHIAARADEFLRTFFGETLCRQNSARWRILTRPTVIIDLKPSGLVWFDYETHTGGGIINLIASERLISESVAIKMCEGWIRLVDGDQVVPPDEKLKTRPPKWPSLDATHGYLWNSGITRLLNDPNAREEIASWQKWPPDRLIPVARAGLLSAPVFDLWPSSIDQQLCAAFPVMHPERLAKAGSEVWRSQLVQLHLRFHRDAVRRNGTPLSWIYAPTMNSVGVIDGGSAPLVIGRDGSDPIHSEQCRCAIFVAGAWDALALLLAAEYIDEDGTLKLPSGLAIVGIRGTGLAGADSYLRHYAHWRPDTAILLVPADKASLAGIDQMNYARHGFVEQLARRGARVIPHFLKTSVSGLYSTGRFSRKTVNESLARSEAA